MSETARDLIPAAMAHYLSRPIMGVRGICRWYFQHDIVVGQQWVEDNVVKPAQGQIK